MTEMIERVARAICLKVCYEAKFRGGKKPCVPLCEECKNEARAAIEAMREPSQPMKATGVNVLVDLSLDGPDGVSWYEVEALWDSMIDEALKEKPAPDESEAGT